MRRTGAFLQGHAIVAISLLAASTGAGQVLLYDSFDTYGSGDCPSDNFVADEAAFLAVWPASPGCRSLIVENAYLNQTNCTSFLGTTPPVNLKVDKNGNQRNVHDLSSDVGVLYPGFNAIQGTNEKPLVLQVYIDGGITGSTGDFATPQTNVYVELTAPDAIGQEDRAPTSDVIVATDGVTPCSADTCVSTPVNPHNSIAVGIFAHLDPETCDGCTNPRRTQEVALYDGERWWLLRSGYPEGSVGTDDIDVSRRRNLLTLTIYGDTISVESNSTAFGIKTRTNIPRKYMGAFNKVGMGGCVPNPERAIWIDYINVQDGVPSQLDGTPKGACCKPDGTCSLESSADCATAGGNYNGDFSSCPEFCCPIPAADADRDGDVDMDDFGAFQACYSGTEPADLTGQCGCLDKVDTPPGVIDDADFLKFLDCATRPAVLWAPTANCPD